MKMKALQIFLIMLAVYIPCFLFLEVLYPFPTSAGRLFFYSLIVFFSLLYAWAESLGK